MQLDVGRIGLKKMLRLPYRGIHKFFPKQAERMKICLLEIYGRLQEKKLYPQIHQGEAGTIYVDVSVVGNHDYNTGIQRVVNSVAVNIRDLRPSESVCFTQFHDNTLMTTCSNYDSKVRGTEPYEDSRLRFRSGDILFLLDSSWALTPAGERAAKDMHAAGGMVYGLIYDMFPIQYPEWFASQAFIDNFVLWHEFLLREVDGILCISKSTAKQVADYYRKKRISRTRPLQMYVFPMGAEFGSGKFLPGQVRQTLKEFLASARTFLMVGTVEVRKGHAVTVEAFRILTRRGIQAQLLIIGKDGWKNDSFKQALLEPGLAGKILWLEDADDNELNYAYRYSDALIAASMDEGFGLPLVEAAHHGLPIVCSDIPIFHEVAGEYASYFRGMDSEAMAEALQNWLNQAEHPDSAKIRLCKWRESAAYILRVFAGMEKPYEILD